MADLGIEIDFINDKVNYSRPIPKGKNELIAKALGYQKGLRHVIDVTAGLGMDAVMLARLGFQVVSIERNQQIFKLLQEAHQKACALTDEKSWTRQIRFVLADSKNYLKNLDQDKRPQAIYMDPMFPEKKKSAKPRKEMLIFRDLVGEDADSEELLQIALECALERVVVKRPLKAPSLLKKPSHQFEGKSVRFDMYLTRPL